MFAGKNVYNIKVEEGLQGRANKRFRNVVVGTTCALVGYTIGQKLCGDKITKGLMTIFETDPTLKEHFVEAVLKHKKEQLLK